MLKDQLPGNPDSEQVSGRPPLLHVNIKKKLIYIQYNIQYTFYNVIMFNIP
jgi:hypothetical protein